MLQIGPVLRCLRQRVPELYGMESPYLWDVTEGEDFCMYETRLQYGRLYVTLTITDHSSHWTFLVQRSSTGQTKSHDSATFWPQCTFRQFEYCLDQSGNALSPIIDRWVAEIEGKVRPKEVW